MKKPFVALNTSMPQRIIDTRTDTVRFADPQIISMSYGNLLIYLAHATYGSYVLVIGLVGNKGQSLETGTEFEVDSIDEPEDRDSIRRFLRNTLGIDERIQINFFE